MAAKTRVGATGPLSNMPFVAKGETAVSYNPVNDLGTVVVTQVVTKIARIE